MQFEWGQRKASAIVRKHGVAFMAARSVFADPLARIFPDPDHAEVDEREPVVATIPRTICSASASWSNVVALAIIARRATA